MHPEFGRCVDTRDESGTEPIDCWLSRVLMLMFHRGRSAHVSVGSWHACDVLNRAEGFADRMTSDHCKSVPWPLSVASSPRASSRDQTNCAVVLRKLQHQMLRQKNSEDCRTAMSSESTIDFVMIIGCCQCVALRFTVTSA